MSLDELKEELKTCLHDESGPVGVYIAHLDKLREIHQEIGGGRAEFISVAVAAFLRTDELGARIAGRASVWRVAIEAAKEFIDEVAEGLE